MHKFLEVEFARPIRLVGVLGRKIRLHLIVAYQVPHNLEVAKPTAGEQLDHLDFDHFALSLVKAVQVARPLRNHGHVLHFAHVGNDHLVWLVKRTVERDQKVSD